MYCIIKLRAKAPNVDEGTIIDAVIRGLHIGPCQEYLDRRRPKSLRRLFDVMEEYTESDNGRRIRIMERKERKRKEQGAQQKPWHVDQLKTQTHKPVNAVAEAQPQNTSVGPTTRGGRSNKGG